ncbi:MAG: hypothetical protein DMG22_17835 [Acidobacteria bacterium]|nr:MAG: hypothetical protein DMG22_17835 [Acidobacteriota bacterium]
MLKKGLGHVILSSSLVILSEAKNPFHSALRVNFAKNLSSFFNLKSRCFAPLSMTELSFSATRKTFDSQLSTFDF